MTRQSDSVTVLLLACETNDRAPDEQRAVLNEALRLDMERGAFRYWRDADDAPIPPTLVAHAEATYEPSFGRVVSLTSADRIRYERLLDRWARCEECGYPEGAHYADGACPHPGMLPGLLPVCAEEEPHPSRMIHLVGRAHPSLFDQSPEAD
jgi:hypothetical protein